MCHVAMGVVSILANATNLHQLMEEKTVWDQVEKYNHVIKDAV